jgi:hypothetical protein
VETWGKEIGINGNKGKRGKGEKQV